MEVREGTLEDLGMKRMKRIAVSGPTGAIGIALINKCIEEGVEVYAYVRPGSKRRDNIPKTPLVKICDYDLSDFGRVAGLSGAIKLPKIDAFYHFGWAGTIGDGRNDGRLQALNIKYTTDAVALAHAMGARVFIGAGSQAEYGRVEGKLKPDTAADPENGYGIAKLAAGGLSRIMCKRLDMKHIWVRVLSVYGPYDGEATMIMKTIRQLLHGGRPSLTEGKQIWDYLYSKDAGRAFYMLGAKATGVTGENADTCGPEGLDGKVYCLGSGTGRPLRDYIREMRDAIDPSLSLGFGEVNYSDKQVMHLEADISDLTKDTGFKPEVSFGEGIRETIEYASCHACR